MTDLGQYFTRLEAQVILLAATHERECKGLAPREPRKNRFMAFLARFLPADAVKPLANKRLEALRRLTCACFASRGSPGERAVREAIEKGLTSNQIRALSHLVRRQLGNLSSASTR